MNLKGAVATADATHCQKQTAKITIDREPDYVIPDKDKQAKFLAAIVDRIDKWSDNSFNDKRVRFQTKKEKNRGRPQSSCQGSNPCPAPAESLFC